MKCGQFLFLIVQRPMYVHVGKRSTLFFFGKTNWLFLSSEHQTSLNFYKNCTYTLLLCRRYVLRFENRKNRVQVCKKIKTRTKIKRHYIHVYYILFLLLAAATRKLPALFRRQKLNEISLMCCVFYSFVRHIKATRFA